MSVLLGFFGAILVTFYLRYNTVRVSSGVCHWTVSQSYHFIPHQWCPWVFLFCSGGTPQSHEIVHVRVCMCDFMQMCLHKISMCCFFYQMVWMCCINIHELIQSHHKLVAWVLYRHVSCTCVWRQWSVTLPFSCCPLSYTLTAFTTHKRSDAAHMSEHVCVEWETGLAFVLFTDRNDVQ